MAKKEKAYKLLAIQEGISNRAAKDLIDRGIVFVGNKRVQIARGELDVKSKFKVQKIEKIKKIFEDENIIAVDKPVFLNSEEVSKKLGYSLLNRLDKETSGVLLLVKNEEFQKKAIKEYKEQRVLKEYIAWVEGKVTDEIEIDKPILTIKKGKAYSKISKDGKEALSMVEPLMIEGNSSKVKVTIKTGRTHQVRVHLKSIAHPVIGDTQYGGKPYKRIMLHSSKTELLGYSFVSQEPIEFSIR
jgi:23S rRNA-/tRNA-specific pseudouridylate synthase